MVSAAVTPRVRIMAICDRVRESRTEAGVFDLKGVRQQLLADAFPFVPSRLWLFLVLSSPRAGSFAGYIRIVHDRTDRTIFYSYLHPRPRFGPDGGFLPYRVRVQCTFPEGGRYTVHVCFFQALGSDVVKAELPFDVTEVGEV